LPRGTQIGRWWTIVQELQASRLGLPAETLAQRHGWNPRTVYRDLRGLEDAGLPITSAGGRWRLVEGWQRALPFPITLGERIALGFARALMTPLEATPVARDFDKLYERLAGSQAPRDTRQGELFRRIRPLLSTPSRLAIDYGEHAAVVETLCAASERQRTVRAVYYTESRREQTRRDVDPYHVHWDPRLEALYVFGWCHLRKDVRTFAVHRFRQVTATKKEFELPATFSPETYLRGAFRIWRAQNAIAVRLAVDPSDAGWVSERRWHSSQKLRRRADGGCEIEWTVDPGAELQRFILQLGAAVEVLAPDSLRREIAAEHAAAAKRGRRSTRQESLAFDDGGLKESRSSCPPL
jgi:predicted DNA-binding transcriptional regulator YafY